MRRLLPSALLCLSALALTSCDDTTAPADPTAEGLAARIAAMPTIDLIHIFDEASIVYIFTTGTRSDAIRMSRAELEGTMLAVHTIDQGTYYFALDEAKGASINGNSLVLRF